MNTNNKNENEINKSVWVVDDEDEILDIYEEILKDSFKVIKFNSAKKALSALEAKQEEIPMIILTDMMMPEMNGVEFLTELRNQNINSPAVLVSGVAQNNQLKDCLNLNVLAFLEKPFKAIDLKNAIFKLINEYMYRFYNLKVIESYTQHIEHLETMNKNYWNRVLLLENSLYERGIPAIEKNSEKKEYLKILSEDRDLQNKFVNHFYEYQKIESQVKKLSLPIKMKKIS